VRPYNYPRWYGHTPCNGQLKRPVFGAPVSLIGSELPALESTTWLRPFALPRPDALSSCPNLTPVTST
jgi:hypothetical protein